MTGSNNSIMLYAFAFYIHGNVSYIKTANANCYCDCLQGILNLNGVIKTSDLAIPPIYTLNSFINILSI